MFARKVSVHLKANGAAEFKKKIESEVRSEEHTSELQSRLHLVCRLLLEKKTAAGPLPDRDAAPGHRPGGGYRPDRPVPAGLRTGGASRPQSGLPAASSQVPLELLRVLAS